MENKNIMVGRHQELVLLQEIISSPKAELVAVYGRRRSLLIRPLMQNMISILPVSTKVLVKNN